MSYANGMAEKVLKIIIMDEHQWTRAEEVGQLLGTVPPHNFVRSTAAGSASTYA